jgi:hypothetical protein
MPVMSLPRPGGDDADTAGEVAHGAAEIGGRDGSFSHEIARHYIHGMVPEAGFPCI